MQQLDTKHLTHTKTLQGPVGLEVVQIVHNTEFLKSALASGLLPLPAAAYRAAAAKPSTPPDPWQAALHPHTCIGHSPSNESHGVTPLQALRITEK